MSKTQWYEDRYRHVFLDFHIPDIRPYALTRIDTKSIAETFARAGAEVAYIQAKDNQGLFHYPTRIGPRHTGTSQRDVFGELVRELSRRNIVAVAYVNASRDRYMYAREPEWRQKWQDGSDRGELRSMPDWEVMCLNSPYRDYVLQTLHEVASSYDIQGVWLDRVDFGGRLPGRFSCRCKYCQQRFFDEVGEQIPETADWTNPAWTKFLRWRSKVLSEFLQECKDVLRNANPRVALTYNYFGVYEAVSAWSHGQDIEEATDAADFLAPEIHFEREGYIAHSLFARMGRGLSDGKPVVLGIFRFGGDYDFGVKPRAQLEAEVFSAIANGAATMIIDQVYPDGTLDTALYDRIGEIYQQVKAREPWLRSSRPIKSVALYYSKDTRNSEPQRAEEYQLAFLGAYKALLDEHVVFDVIGSRMLLSRITDYQVVVLPDAQYLDEEEIAALRAFVHAGGGLVATYKTALSTMGRTIGEFASGDLFGVSFRGALSYHHSYLEVAQAGPLSTGLDHKTLPHRGPHLRVEPKGEATQVPIRLRYPDTGFGTVCGNPPLDPPGRVTRYPGAVINEYGRGRVVYFPGSITYAFAKWGYPNLRRLFINAVRLVGAAEPIVEVKAPTSVEVTAYEQDCSSENKRYIVHLVNFQPGVGRNVAISRDRFIG